MNVSTITERGNTSWTTFATPIAASHGAMMLNDGLVRLWYQKNCLQLVSDAISKRNLLKYQAYQKLTPLGKSFTDIGRAFRKNLGIHDPSRAPFTSVTWNRIGTAARFAGVAFLAISVVSSVNRIRQLPEDQQDEALVKAGGAMAGSYIVGNLGGGLGRAIGLKLARQSAMKVAATTLAGSFLGAAIGVCIGALIAASIFSYLQSKPQNTPKSPPSPSTPSNVMYLS